MIDHSHSCRPLVLLLASECLFWHHSAWFEPMLVFLIIFKSINHYDPPLPYPTNYRFECILPLLYLFLPSLYQHHRSRIIRIMILCAIISLINNRWASTLFKFSWYFFFIHLSVKVKTLLVIVLNYILRTLFFEFWRGIIKDLFGLEFYREKFTRAIYQG